MNIRTVGIILGVIVLAAAIPCLLDPSKKRLLYFVLLLAVLGVVFITAFVVDERSFDVCTNTEQRGMPKERSSRLKIGIIGDSWVVDQQLDQAVLDGMLDAGIQAEVVSSGQPGATSRQIYRNLTSDNMTPYSGRHLLQDENLDYLVVVAGVNDTVEHIGREFYAHHMLCIIKAILNRGIHPVILEVPEYGIEETPSKSFQNYMKRLVYRMLFDKNEKDVIIAYRDALRMAIPPALMEKISVVEFSPLTQNYSGSKEYFSNPNHLSKDGSRKLGQMIAKAIIESEKKTLPGIAVRR